MHLLINWLRHFILYRILRIDTWFNDNFDSILGQIRNGLNLPGDIISPVELKKLLGYCADDVYFARPNVMTSPKKIFLYEDTNVYQGAKFIMSPEGENGKFILKAHSGASQGLTVITGLHGYKVGEWSRSLVNSRELDIDSDVIVEEDVRIGANVTILPGVTIGRGAIVGACSVVTRNVPPYSIVAGNPAKVIRYKFTEQQIKEHELKLYKE